MFRHITKPSSAAVHTTRWLGHVFVLLSRRIVRPAADDDLAGLFEGGFYVCLCVCVSGMGGGVNLTHSYPPSCFRKN